MITWPDVRLLQIEYSNAKIAREAAWRRYDEAIENGSKNLAQLYFEAENAEKKAIELYNALEKAKAEYLER